MWVGAPECQWFDNTTYVGMQKPRWYSSAEALGDGSIVIVGGFVTGGYINRCVRHPATLFGQHTQKHAECGSCVFGRGSRAYV